MVKSVVKYAQLPAGDKKILVDIGTSFKFINEIKEYDKNSRVHSELQVKQISESMKAFGFLMPVLIQENEILAGHGRIMAAKLLELSYVPFISASNLSEAQKKAFIIADNKIAANGGWDDDILKSELEFLKDLQFDLDLTGFEEKEITKLLETEEKEYGKKNVEFQASDFQSFEHKCPKCGFEYDE